MIGQAEKRKFENGSGGSFPLYSWFRAISREKWEPERGPGKVSYYGK
jgi:hypothetical protein